VAGAQTQCLSHRNYALGGIHDEIGGALRSPERRRCSPLAGTTEVLFREALAEALLVAAPLELVEQLQRVIASEVASGAW
jgi:hypothetical protein